MIAHRTRLLAIANLLYAVFLLSLGILPDLPAARVSDHTAHGLAYGFQAALLYAFLLSLQSRGRAALLAIACTLVWGSLIEGLQLVQPARTFEFLDLAANGVGAAVTVSIAYLLTGQKGVEAGK
jgi:VanZ family protein